jgi:hypothetical protein
MNRYDHSPLAYVFVLIVGTITAYLMLCGIDLHVQERESRIKPNITELGGGYGDAHLRPQSK